MGMHDEISAVNTKIGGHNACPQPSPPPVISRQQRQHPYGGATVSPRWKSPEFFGTVPHCSPLPLNTEIRNKEKAFNTSGILTAIEGLRRELTGIGPTATKARRPIRASSRHIPSHGGTSGCHTRGPWCSQINTQGDTQGKGPNLTTCDEPQ